MSEENKVNKNTKITLLKGARASIQTKKIAIADLIAMTAVLLTILSGIYYIGGLNVEVEGNSRGLNNNMRKIESIRKIHALHLRDSNIVLKKINGDMGYIKGQLEILVKRSENK